MKRGKNFIFLRAILRFRVLFIQNAKPLASQIDAANTFYTINEVGRKVTTVAVYNIVARKTFCAPKTVDAVIELFRIVREGDIKGLFIAMCIK